MDQKANFWATLPGILTGLAALVTAITGLYIALKDDAPAATQQAIVTEERDQSTYSAAQGTAEHSEDAIAIAVIDSPRTPSTASSDGLVDCANPAFQLPNTIDSLMSWSNHYHGQIPTVKPGRTQALYPCQQALAYRGSAHCQTPGDTKIRQALFETLSLCRAAGVDVSDLVK